MIIANPSAPSYWGPRSKPAGWVFHFGAYGNNHVFVWREPGTTSLDDALEAAADAALDVWPGLFTSTKELYDEALAEMREEDPNHDIDDEDVQQELCERAEMDMTTVDSGNYAIPSWEWGVNDASTEMGDALIASLKADSDHSDDQWEHIIAAADEFGVGAAARRMEKGG